MSKPNVKLSTFNRLSDLGSEYPDIPGAERILEALDEAAIQVTVLKGAALTATMCEDVGLAAHRDFNLLVRQEFEEHWKK